MTGKILTPTLFTASYILDIYESICIYINEAFDNQHHQARHYSHSFFTPHKKVPKSIGVVNHRLINAKGCTLFQPQGPPFPSNKFVHLFTDFPSLAL